MPEETMVVEQAAASPRSSDPLETMVSEIGATYPLMAYTTESGEQDEAEAINAAILAGLVAP
jgi:hypothetical protein